MTTTETTHVLASDAVRSYLSAGKALVTRGEELAPDDSSLDAWLAKGSVYVWVLLEPEQVPLRAILVARGETHSIIETSKWSDPISPGRRDTLRVSNDRIYRTVEAAHYAYHSSMGSDINIGDLIFISEDAIQDKARQDARRRSGYSTGAGVRTVMVTRTMPKTVEFILDGRPARTRRDKCVLPPRVQKDQ